MFDVVLHTGAEHPDLLWIVAPSMISLFTGIGIGIWSEQLREWFLPQDTEAVN